MLDILLAFYFFLGFFRVFVSKVYTTRKFLVCDEEIRRKKKEFRRKSKLRRKSGRNNLSQKMSLQKFATDQGFVVSLGRSQPPCCDELRHKNSSQKLRRTSVANGCDEVRGFVAKSCNHFVTTLLIFCFFFLFFSVFCCLNVLFSNFT